MNEIDLASYADDNTPHVTGHSIHVTGDNIEDALNSLENNSIKLFKWFADNHMKVNPYFPAIGSEKHRIRTKYRLKPNRFILLSTFLWFYYFLIVSFKDTLM